MIGKRLIELRSKKKLTQKSVAEKLKISRSAYSNYESDFREPDFKNAELLADLFGVSVDNLLGRESKESFIEETEVERMKREIMDIVNQARTEEDIKSMLYIVKKVMKE